MTDLSTFKAAFEAAIRLIGLEAFKNTSLFAHNERAIK